MRKETIQIRSESRNTIKHIKDPEYKLEYVLTMLGLSQLFQTFLSSTITFIELIQMTKNDLFKLNLELYQRNRLFNFIQCYKKTETNDSFEELLKFFTNHKQFVFYNKLKQSNYEKGCLLTAKFFNEENVRKKIDVFQDINSNKGDNKNNHSNMNNNNNEIDNEEMNIEDYWHSESKMNKSNYNDCNNNCGNIDKTTSLKLFVNNSNKQKYKYDYFKRMKTRSSVSSSYMFNDSIYKSYLNINNSTDKIIEKLKKSKKERQLKYAKFHLLLNKSGIKTTLHHYHQQQLSKFNIRSESSQYENENGNNEMVYSINNSRSSEIDLLTTIINRKKQLQNALNKCNNSIYENRKLLVHLSNEMQSIEFNTNEIKENRMNKNRSTNMNFVNKELNPYNESSRPIESHGINEYKDITKQICKERQNNNKDNNFTQKSYIDYNSNYINEL